MFPEIIPRLLIEQKLKIKRKRLGKIEMSEGFSPTTIDDYLILSNNHVIEYFKQDRNLLRRIWEYRGLSPKCLTYSTYTYAAFLSITEEQKREDLQEGVRFVGGIYVNLRDMNLRGHHAWLEKRSGNKWEAFETIPSMRKSPAYYSPWYTFQLSKRKSKITSERFMGLFAICTYSPFF